MDDLSQFSGGDSSLYLEGGTLCQSVQKFCSLSFSSPLPLRAVFTQNFRVKLHLKHLVMKQGNASCIHTQGFVRLS